ncbi:transporter substrate-binding domain-containing protein [Marinobacter halodurans]|uniref:Transporter substrate-binding domain-containing protein n=1 Tax=Marinobacter halodurans TaxID=2528979 RepID=A0ABY1ZN91_9GAMM|nr:transporter substrate-binding domain-containing protein [Marinobacter halodurans]TBW57964.1 transporter substrate-binding domain-containing protein [Marinobacter halodurans]
MTSSLSFRCTARKTVLAWILATLPFRCVAMTSSVNITSGSWPPYLEDTPSHGIIGQIIDEAFAEEGMAVRWGFFPWARSFRLAQKGIWDGSAAWACTPERAPDFYFSDAIIPVRLAFFYRRSDPIDWTTIDDLKGLRIGLSRDYHYGDTINQAIANGTLESEIARSDDINFRKLLAGRIDLFPIDVAVGRRLLARSFTQDEIARLAVHPRVVYATQLRLMLSRHVAGNEARLQQFNKGLQALRLRGRIDAIMAHAASELPYPVTLYGDEPDPAECNFAQAPESDVPAPGTGAQ